MKMVVAILRDQDNEVVTNSLVVKGFTVTQIASTGGFLRQGRSTLMVGVDDDKVDEAIQLINEKCELTVEPFRKRATIFVINVDHFEQF
jgi:uncharacterized protein YaaQ